MDLNPQRVRQADFKTVKRGLDPDEVRRFLQQVADELENAQNQSTAMEARARAAVARLQELSDGAESQAAATAAEDSTVASAEQADTISRTLLLAQRTADTTIAQAEAEGDRLLNAATEEAAATLDSTREMAAQLMEEARDEARKVGESERAAVASEVSSLKARRDFLESDVDHLEQFLITQRERLREAAGAMVELTERVPGGLGEVRRPLLSASDDEVADLTSEPVDTAGEPATWRTTSNDEPADEVEVPEFVEVEADVPEIAGVEDVAAQDVAAQDVGAREDAPVDTIVETTADTTADTTPDPGVEVAPDAVDDQPQHLLITPDIADLPADDAEPEPDPTPTAFGIADASGELEVPDEDLGAPARFTFDEHP